MKRSLASALGVAFTAATAMGAASQECEFQRPSDSVFDIVDDKRVKAGTAVLVDAQQGLFLTAFHLLGSPKLRLQRDNQEWAFTKVMGGRNSANLYEDWAIITIGEAKLPLYEGIHLIYDMPSSESLRKSGVFNSAQSVGNVGSVRWNDTIQDGMACLGRGVTFMRLNDYDKGDSGSPLFSPDECGIVGLTSRFILEEDASDVQQKEVVQLFQEFSEGLSREDRARLSIQTSLEGRKTVVREILKNEMYVKIVPAKCVLDGVIDETFFRDNRKGIDILNGAVRAEIKRTLDFIPSIDLNSASTISRFARQVYKQSLRWPEIVYMWNKYQRGKIEGTLKNGALSSSLRTAIEGVSSTRKFSYIYTTYDRLGQATSSSEAGGRGLDLSQFIKRNTDWSVTEAEDPLVGLDVGQKGPPDASSGLQMITAGLEILDLLEQLPDEELRYDDLVNFYKNASAVLLTSGLSRAGGDNASVEGRALIGLAKLVSDEASKLSNPTVMKSQKELARNLETVGASRGALQPFDPPMPWSVPLSPADIAPGRAP